MTEDQQHNNMDFDSAVSEIGEFGPFQKKLFYITNLLSFPIYVQTLVMVFVAAKPTWSCTKSHDNMCNQDGTICKDAVFTSNFTSIVSDWGLVCGQAYKVEAIQSVFMFGSMFGAPFLGNMADKYGRKPVYIVCYVGTCALTFLSAFATSYNTFMVLYLVIGFFAGGGGLIAFVLTTEIVGAKYRGLVGTIQMTFFSLFLIALGCLAYMIRDWRYITIATVAIAPIQLFLFPSLPESARWLASQARYSEAEEILHKAAAINNPHLKSKPLLNREQKKTSTKNNNSSVLSMFTHKNTCKRLLNICLLFSVNSLVYYGLSFNLKNLGGNLYLNFVLAGAVEIPANICVVFLLSYLGRRRALFIFMMGTAFTCFVCMRLQESDSSNAFMISSAAMIGKGFITSSFSVIYIYGSELLPTVVRNAGLGVASVANRIGSIASPFVVLLGEKNKALPMLTFALCALISGLIGATLPETHGKTLPETFEDVENPSSSNSSQKKSQVKI